MALIGAREHKEKGELKPGNPRRLVKSLPILIPPVHSSHRCRAWQRQPIQRRPLDDAWEQELLLAWWQEALEGLSQSSFFAGLAESALISDLKQVCRFGPGVDDRLAENGAQAHDAKRYLGSREVGDAVAAGL